MGNSQKIRRIVTHYARRVAPNRPGYDILDWASREAQQIRFEIIGSALSGVRHPDWTSVPDRRETGESRMRRVDLPSAVLLDVGCGLTEFGDWLEEHGGIGMYIGVDLVEAVLQEAHRRRPRRNLVLADVFNAPPFRSGTPIDVAVCSGVFNLKLGNNDRFVAHALAALVRLTGACVAANFLHVRAKKKYPHCHYYDPERIMQYIPREVEEVWLYDRYLDNDFTLVLWRRPAGGAVDASCLG